MINLLGRKFGQLTVIKKDNEKFTDKSGRKRIHWICKCDCGKIISVNGEYLRGKETTRCQTCRYQRLTTWFSEPKA